MFSDWLDPDLHKRCTVVRHDPERHSNVLMPCAVCGFEAALNGDVRRKGFKSTCRGIVCFGGQTRFLGGVLYWCKRCKVKHDEHKSVASTAASSSASASAPKHHYHWMSYDPRITKLYVEKGRADVTRGLKAIVFNRGYCWDSALARFLRLSWGAGICAGKMAKLLRSVAAAEFDYNTLLPFLHSQLKHQNAGTIKVSGAQPSAHDALRSLRSSVGEPVEDTLPSAPRLPYEPVSLNATECGVFSPGSGSIRRLCNDLQEADENYQFVHREDSVGCYVAQCDHTDKYLLVNQYAPHVFSIMNERGEILLRIATATTSYNDPALIAALQALFGKAYALILSYCIVLSHTVSPHSQAKMACSVMVDWRFSLHMLMPLFAMAPVLRGTLPPSGAVQLAVSSRFQAK